MCNFSKQSRCMTDVNRAIIAFPHILLTKHSADVLVVLKIIALASTLADTCVKRWPQRLKTSLTVFTIPEICLPLDTFWLQTWHFATKSLNKLVPSATPCDSIPNLGRLTTHIYKNRNLISHAGAAAAFGRPGRL